MSGGTLQASVPVTLANAANFSNNAAITIGGSGPITFSGPVALAGANQVTLNNSGGTTVSGIITGTAANTLTLTGAGALSLPNANGSNNFAIVLNGATLVGGNNTALGTGAVTANSGAIIANTNVTLNNNITFGTNGALTVGGGNGVTFGGTLTLAGSDTLNLATGQTTWSGSILIGATGTNLTLTGAGTLNLPNLNSNTSSTTLNGATLILGNNAALGSGTLILTSGALQTSLAAGLTLGNPVAFTSNGAATLGGNNAIVISGSTVTLVGANTLTVNNATTITDVIGGAAASLILGANSTGTLTLAPTTSNTYGGGTTLAGGTLNIGSAASSSAGILGSGTLTLAGGTLQNNTTGTYTVVNPLAFSNNASVILAGANALTFTSGSTINLLGTDTISVTNAGGVTITDGITGSGGLTLAGSGALTLTGADSYAGATLLNGGTLTLSGANGALTASSGITVNSGGTLLLNNATNNNTARLGAAIPVIMNGGTLSLVGGAAAASQTFAGGEILTLNSGNSTISLTPGAAQSAILTFGDLVRNPGATASFIGTNLGASSGQFSQIKFGTPPTLQNGTILPYATVNNAAFATYGANGIAAAASAATPTSGITTTDALLNTVGATTLTANTAVNSLVINATAGSIILNLGGNTLTVGSGGILGISANAANSITITNGTLNFGSAQGILFTDGSAATNLAVAANITGNGGLALSAGASSVTLSGVNTYSAANSNAIQSLTLGGVITGGTFTLSFNGQTTAPINWTLSSPTLANAIQSALTTLSTIGLGNVVVLNAAGAGNGPLFLIDFVGALAAAAQPQIAVVSNSLSGTSPTVVTAIATAGYHGTALNSGNLVLGSPLALPAGNNATSAVTSLSITSGGSYVNAIPAVANFGVSTILSVTNTANPTITTTSAHNLLVGQQVTISGVNGATGVNGTFAVTSGLPRRPSRSTMAVAPGVYSAGGVVNSLASSVTAVTNTVNPTITTSAAHNLVIGQTVVIAGVNGATGVNGTFVVATAPTANTFTITLAAAPGVYTSGGVVTSPAPAITGVLNQINAVITTAVTHNFLVGEQVTIAGVNGATGVNGTWTISAVTANTFTINNPSASGTYTPGTSGGIVINPVFSITAATNAVNAIVTTNVTHDLLVGQTVTIAGVTGAGAGLNGTWTVTAVTATTFTINNTVAPGGVAAGGLVGLLNAAPATALYTASVTGISNLVAGSNFSAATTVAFSAAPAGGITATGAVSVVGGTIAGITITNPGSGYTTPPTIAFGNVGSGVGAAATPTMTVTGSILTNGGSGYTLGKRRGHGGHQRFRPANHHGDRAWPGGWPERHHCRRQRGHRRQRHFRRADGAQRDDLHHCRRPARRLHVRRLGGRGADPRRQHQHGYQRHQHGQSADHDERSARPRDWRNGDDLRRQWRHRRQRHLRRAVHADADDLHDRSRRRTRRLHFGRHRHPHGRRGGERFHSYERGQPNDHDCHQSRSGGRAASDDCRRGRGHRRERNLDGDHGSLVDDFHDHRSRRSRRFYLRRPGGVDRRRYRRHGAGRPVAHQRQHPDHGRRRAHVARYRVPQ